MSVPRIKSETAFYHVMNRGVALMDIFGDDKDRRVFLGILKTCSEATRVEIHAYCLMSNHYHLLVRDHDDNLSIFAQRLNAAYATYFNERYERVGPLFQGRFRSECIKDDRHYLAVLRYIIQNPLKAGISAADKYPWSSYREYGQAGSLVETLFAIELYGDLDQLRDFLRTPSDETFLDVPVVRTSSDSALRAFMRDELEVEPTALAQMPEAERKRALRTLRTQGFSIRRVERVTGISRGILQKLER